MANTLSTYEKRNKYFQAMLDKSLRDMLVAEKVCTVDRSDSYTIQNPYGSQPTVEVTGLTGTYTPADYTITDSTLTITDEFKVGEHVFDFEQVISNHDIIANRIDEQVFAIAKAVDKWVVNNLCEDGTGTYSTPSGSFSAANVPTIVSSLIAKVSGYADAMKGLFLVIEQSDLPGFLQAGVASGFSYADAVLNNGKVGQYMGVDIYVVLDGTFASETKGTKTYTNSGHRVFGVKGVSTYASPRGTRYEEISVTGKTGKEIRSFALCGFKLWATKANFIVDITVTA